MPSSRGSSWPRDRIGVFIWIMNYRAKQTTTTDKNPHKNEWCPHFSVPKLIILISYESPISVIWCGSNEYFPVICYQRGEADCQPQWRKSFRAVLSQASVGHTKPLKHHWSKLRCAPSVKYTENFKMLVCGEKKEHTSILLIFLY